MGRVNWDCNSFSVWLSSTSYTVIHANVGTINQEQNKPSWICDDASQRVCMMQWKMRKEIFHLKNKTQLSKYKLMCFEVSVLVRRYSKSFINTSFGQKTYWR